MNFINVIRTWWANHHEDLYREAGFFVEELADVCNRVGNNALRLAVIGLILNIVAKYCPELPKRFPILFDWFDGWLQLVEFAVKGALGTVYSMFTGNLSDFWAEYAQAYHELQNQFLHWLAMIHF